MRNGWKLAALLTVGGLGCTTTAPARPEPPPQTAIDSGNAALQALQVRLFQRLSQTMGEGGPTAAVTVCRDEAQALTAQVSAEQGMAVGRTSHRLRNPANAPREWVKPYLAEWAGKKASEIQPVVVDLGDRVGLLRPIPTAELCTTCHGASEKLAPEIQATLQKAYPEDQATGFAPGDLRGLFWAEVPRTATPR